MKIWLILKSYLKIILISVFIGLLTYLFISKIELDFIKDLYFNSEIQTKYLDLSTYNFDHSESTIKIRSEPRFFEITNSYIDFRVLVFRKYFEINESPLLGYEQDIVDACEKYGAPKDCTIIIGIAKVETDLCKYLPSQDQKNCWGFGGSGENRFEFYSYSTGINAVIYRLVKGYGVKAMMDPNSIELIYCGPRESCKKWGENVQKVMDDLNILSISMGFRALYDLR